MDTMELIRTRKSVRTYDGSPLSRAHRAELEAFAANIENPFGIPVEFRFLDADAFGLSSPVLTGERLYVGAKVKKGPLADAAYGFSFEKLVLAAWRLGIGTVWIGGTMKREIFERAMELSPDEMMPCVTPLGYPAKRRSVKEVMMRKGVRADDRKPAEALFFSGDFSHPLCKPASAAIADALEMVRLAPSAVNKQPWRVVVRDGTYHFYEKRDKGYVSDAVGDLQEVDVGIALCHFMTGLESAGLKGDVVVSEPDISHETEMLYIASVANVRENVPADLEGSC